MKTNYAWWTGWPRKNTPAKPERTLEKRNPKTRNMPEPPMSTKDALYRVSQKSWQVWKGIAWQGNKMNQLLPLCYVRYGTALINNLTSNPYEKMATVTRNVSRVGFLMKFLLITIWKKVNDSFMRKYDDARIKSENPLVWHIKQDNSSNDKTQTILFWLKQIFCLLEPITQPIFDQFRQIWYQSLSVSFLFPTSYNLLIYLVSSPSYAF